MATQTRELTCIGCPLGCPLTVTLENDRVTAVAGNTCPRGDAYARKEVTNPTRIVTTTVRITGAHSGAVTVPCKTRTDVPKAAMFDVVRALRDVTVCAPVHIGDVLAANVAHTGVDVVATAEVE